MLRAYTVAAAAADDDDDDAIPVLFEMLVIDTGVNNIIDSLHA